MIKELLGMMKLYWQARKHSDQPLATLARLLLILQDFGSFLPLELFIIALCICINAENLSVDGPWRTAYCSNPAARYQSSRIPQFLYSPKYPGSGYHYPDNASCSWVMNSPVETARIQVRVFRENFACCCNQDYLLIRDGSNSKARPIAILCHDLNPVTITSSGPALYGEFRSDGDGHTGYGYTLLYEYYDSQMSCPPGWIRRDLHGFYIYCYKLYDEPLSWQQAASRCGYDGGFLTSIVNQEENDFLVEAFGNETSLVWIGMDKYGFWLDGSGSSAAFLNFIGRETTSIYLCAVIDFANNGRWTVTGCGNEHPKFICKKRQDGTNGRYWTEVDTGDTSGGFVHTYILIPSIIISLVFILVVCCRGKTIDDWLCVIVLRFIYGAMCLCLTYVRLRPRDCCLRRLSGEPVNHHAIDLDNTTPSGSPVRRVQGMRRASGNSQPPPDYSEVTPAAPPPTYMEALDPIFDFQPVGIGQE